MDKDMLSLQDNFRHECSNDGVDKKQVEKILKAVESGNLGKLSKNGLFLLFDMLGVNDERNPLEEALYVYTSYLWAPAASTSA